MVRPPKVKFVFDRRKRASRTNTGSLEIEVTYNNLQYRFATGVTLYSTQWKDGRVTKCDDQLKLNRRLNEMILNVEDYVYEQESKKIPSLSVSVLKSVAYGNPLSGETMKFLPWLEQRIKMRPIAESTRRQHFVMFRSIKESGLFVTFQDLTTANIKKWDDMLKRQVKCQSSVHGYHKRLKPYIADALQLELLLKSPYQHLQIKRSDGTTTKKFLKEYERDSIEALDLSGGEEKTRDMFIFSCYTGLSYSDLVKIKKEDFFFEGDKLILEDKRQKTGVGYHITILPKAREILEKYDYNLNLMSNQKCNQYLKIIAFRCNIRINLTMHVGRHTFATWALANGVRIEIVSKMLGHADIKTTQIYAKMLQEEIDKGYEILSNLCKSKSNPKAEKKESENDDFNSKEGKKVAKRRGLKVESYASSREELKPKASKVRKKDKLVKEALTGRIN